MRITPTSMPTNSGVLVSSVPALTGTGCCLASEPARPRAKISGANRPIGIVMLIGRFAPEIFALGLAGSLAKQQPVPVSAGTLDTRTPLFVGMLVGVILILVGLTYFPALALGPFAEGLH